MVRGLAPTLAAASLVVTALLGGCSFAGSAGEPRADGVATGATSGSADQDRSAVTGAPSTVVDGTRSAGAGTTPRAAGTPTPQATGTAPQPTGSASAGAGPTAVTTPGVERCHTAGLTAGLVPGSAGAGQRYATLVLRNAGSRPCTVLGYGGIGLRDSAGRPVPSDQVRVTPPSPAPVTLAPGGSASSQLHWSVVPGRGDAASGTCQPVAATLGVIPPDETTAISVPWSGGPVCEGGTVQQQPYVAG